MTQEPHVVLLGVTPKFGSVARWGLTKELTSWGLSKESAQEFVANLERGMRLHPPIKWRSKPQPEKWIKFMSKTLIAELCTCDGRNLDASGSLDLTNLRSQLSSDDRPEALRILIEAAQYDPDACDALMDDALARNDVLQADHWQSKKRQIKTPITPPQAAASDSSKKSTWMGVSQEVDGGDF